MRTRCALLLSVLFLATMACGQEVPEQVSAIAGKPIQSHEDVIGQLREYLMARAPQLPKPVSAQAWTERAEQIRKHLLNDVVFHGWPREWVDAPPRFEQAGTTETGKGYRIVKLRYEVVPGFWSAALLYEPAELHGKVPAILNVNGHVGPQGKAVDWKQKRCINYALRGMLALNIEYVNMGELFRSENDHGYLGHLDLVGASGVGLFYLVMRKALDYLYENPNVDRDRVGLTGLSGGGWQSIVLGSLDKRVKVDIPVAGYCAFANQLARIADMGDNEQDATDFFDGQDYVFLTAMRAPRPTLLINNAEDSCCFRAPLVKPYLYDQVKPYFALYGAQDDFQFHQNTDPGYHNYKLDNRQQSYRFFDKYFHLSASDKEIPVDSEIKTYQQLVVGLPADNQTILGLARELAARIKRDPIPPAASRTEWIAAQRAKLKEVVRYKPVTMKHVWAVANTFNSGLASISYRFELSNGLSATGVWFKETDTPDGAPVDIVLDDKGRKGAAGEVWNRMEQLAYLLDRGDQVVLVDLLFTGDASPAVESPSYVPSLFASAVATVGDRPLGLESAQLVAVTRWAEETFNSHPVHVELTGIRTQMAALIAAAIEPGLFSSVTVHQGMKSLDYLLQHPVGFDDAPDLFCLDLYKDFDVDCLIAVAGPTKFLLEDSVENTSSK
ncbi:MAG TPA: acetylxylan esterase [Terriglobia bacterium]|nr:acetylxylan esterase [Terriglobia bacterium]